MKIPLVSLLSIAVFGFASSGYAAIVEYDFAVEGNAHEAGCGTFVSSSHNIAVTPATIVAR